MTSTTAVKSSAFRIPPASESWRGFRTAPNRAINPATDDLGAFVGFYTIGEGVNDAGQAVGYSWTWDNGGTVHAFRTRPNQAIDVATDDLGPGSATDINTFGQVVGTGSYGAFRTTPNNPINPATDYLGTLGGTFSTAIAINNFGQVIGSATLSGDSAQHAFLYSGGMMHDLYALIPQDSGWVTLDATGINDQGQIAATGRQLDGLSQVGPTRALLLTPIYKAFVQQPINADGSSIFNAKRGTIPVKFRLTQYDQTTCNLLPATIAVVKAGGGTFASVDENVYSTQSNSGSDFRITGCQYHYNLAAKELRAGVYRVDISINGIMVGHAVFALK